MGPIKGVNDEFSWTPSSVVVFGLFSMYSESLSSSASGREERFLGVKGEVR